MNINTLHPKHIKMLEEINNNTGLTAYIATKRCVQSKAAKHFCMNILNKGTYKNSTKVILNLYRKYYLEYKNNIREG